MNLLKRRVAALRLLAAGLEASCTALTNLDLSGIHQGIAQQENLCSEIRFLDEEMRRLHHALFQQAGPAEGIGPMEELAQFLDPGGVKQLGDLFAELQTCHARVRYLNSVHGGLLRRSRRSVNVLMNFLSGPAGGRDEALRHPAGLKA